MPNDANVELLKRSIQKTKAKLIRKACNGIPENFGRAEVRQISDFASRIIHDGARNMQERQEASKLINEFEDWVATYSPLDGR